MEKEVDALSSTWKTMNVVKSFKMKSNTPIYSENDTLSGIICNVKSEDCFDIECCPLYPVRHERTDTLTFNDNEGNYLADERIRVRVRQSNTTALCQVNGRG